VAAYAPVRIASRSGASEFVHAPSDGISTAAPATTYQRRRLVELTARRWSFDIPLRKRNGPDLVPGFKDHRDGTVSTWNDNGHTDHLYRWTVPMDVVAVLVARDPPRILGVVGRSRRAPREDEIVLTQEQEEAIKFAYGQLKYLEGGPSPAEPGPGRRGWRFARDVAAHIGEATEAQRGP
jgi:hypothetical protein